MQEHIRLQLSPFEWFGDVASYWTDQPRQSTELSTAGRSGNTHRSREPDLQHRTKQPRTQARDAICYYIDPNGRQHFNFVQQIWLDPLVPMAYTHVHSTALTTLAVNLLTFVLSERDYRAAIGTTCRRAVALAREFSEDCLLTAPDQAWVMPHSAIKAWINSRQRPRAAGRARSRRLSAVILRSKG